MKTKGATIPKSSYAKLTKLEADREFEFLLAQVPLESLRDEELRLAMGATGSCIDPMGQPSADSGAGADPFGSPK